MSPAYLKNLAFKKYTLLLLLFIFIFCNRFLILGYAEEDLKQYFNYSSLSPEDKKEEAGLLYKYAKSAYTDGDIETAKILFYQVLELDPGHIGANKYIDYIIPKKISSQEYSKVKEAQLILDKKEELQFKNLESSIESARKQMDAMEKERLAKEALYKSQLGRLQEDTTPKPDIKDDKKIKDRQNADKIKQDKLERKKKIKEEKDKRLQQQKKDTKQTQLLKQKAQENKLPFQAGEITKDDLKAVDYKQRQTEEKLTDNLEKKQKSSWKMIGKELDKLQKKNERIQAKKEQKLKKKDTRERKAKLKQEKKEYRVNKVEEKKKKIDQTIKKKEEKKAESPSYRLRKEKIEAAKQKRQEMLLEKEALRQEKLKQEEINKVEKKQPIREPSQDKQPLSKPREDNISKRFDQQVESALQKKDKNAQIRVLSEQGVYYYKRQRYDLAKQAFAKLLEIEPNNLKALDYFYIFIPEAERKHE